MLLCRLCGPGPAPCRVPPRDGQCGRELHHWQGHSPAEGHHLRGLLQSQGRGHGRNWWALPRQCVFLSGLSCPSHLPCARHTATPQCCQCRHPLPPPLHSPSLPSLPSLPSPPPQARCQVQPTSTAAAMSSPSSTRPASSGWRTWCAH